MGLFNKKTCDICGEKIGLFGNRKLEDGNMCKHCAELLSPWFDERRHSTLEEIKAQLAYREENKKAVAAFRRTLELGENYHVIFDEDAGNFVVVTETGSRMLETVNPDVFSLSQVTGAHVDIDESRSEIYRQDSEGNRQSYNPRRYRYRYNFYVNIHLSHPYVDEIRIKINEYTLEIEWQDQGFSFFSTSSAPTNDYEYRKYKNLCQEIADKLLSGAAETQRENQEPVKASADSDDTGMTTCPYCKSKVKKAKFCTNCGAEL